MLKAIVSGTEGRTLPPPPPDQKQFQLWASGGLQAIMMVSGPSCSRARCPPPGTQKNAAAFYLFNFFPEFQTPYLHFSSPYTKGRFEPELKTVCLGTNPPSSQMAGHLNKEPTKTQSLSVSWFWWWQAARTLTFRFHRNPSCYLVALMFCKCSLLTLLYPPM